MIKNYDSYGTYMLEALYNICTMYGYKPDEIEFTDSVRTLLDGAYKCKFTARGVNFTLVVNTTMEKGFFISDEERADVNYE